MKIYNDNEKLSLPFPPATHFHGAKTYIQIVLVYRVKRAFSFDLRITQLKYQGDLVDSLSLTPNEEFPSLFWHKHDYHLRVYRERVTEIAHEKNPKCDKVF